MSAHEYYLAVNNNAYDIDGYYGAQCWDGFAHFTRKYFGKQYNCSATGYAIDLWDLRTRNGSTAYFDSVGNSNDLKDGDWVIFRKGGATPYTHVAMFRKWHVKGKSMVVLGQNQGGRAYRNGGSAFNQVVMSSATFAGALRPKMYHKKPAVKKSNAEVAKEIIAGKGGWGNGPIRVARLKAKGYNAAAVQAEVNKQVAAKNKPAAPAATYYIVKRGDNLSAIAAKYKTTWQKIQSLNKLQNPNVIKPGQKLRVK